ncbi:MAG: DUF4349 domain-containing protein [Leptospirales bacterium]|nr:DUF4349 domain-containing protein [Leptospirales bacterium]
MKLFAAAAILVCSICLLSCASSSKNAPERAAYDAAGGFADSSRQAESASQRMIARTVSIEIKNSNPEEVKSKINQEVERFKGFIVYESDSRINLRVPAQSLDEFCEQVRKMGKVVSEKKTGEDITDAYHDTLIRLDSLKTVRARYTDLLSKAAKVEDMLGIEKELERVNSQIEMYEGRKKYSESRVAYAYVSIEIDSTVPGPLGWVFYGAYKAIVWLFVWN